MTMTVLSRARTGRPHGGGMDLGGAPVSDLVGLTVPRQQGAALLILGNHQRLPAGGAVDPLACHLQASELSFVTQVSETVEIVALEQALPDVGNAPLHLEFVFGVARTG